MLNLGPETFSVWVTVVDEGISCKTVWLGPKHAGVVIGRQKNQGYGNPFQQSFKLFNVEL